MATKYQYRPRTAEEVSKRENQSSNNYIGVIQDQYKSFSPQKDNWVRIMPPTWEGYTHYGFDIFVHYSVGPNNGTVLCPLKMAGERCPMCDEYAKAGAAGRQDAYNFKPGKRVLAWIVNRKAEQAVEKDVLQVWAMPWTFDRDVSKLCRDRQTGELYQIDNPESGYDLTFDTEGEKPNIKYVGIQIARRPSPVLEKYMELVIATPVTEVLIFRNYEEILDLMSGSAAPTPATDPAPGAAATPTAPQQSLNAPTPAPIPVAAQPAAQIPLPTAPLGTQSTATEFCPNSIVYKGNKVGCVYVAGHQGDHEFDRDLGPVAPPQPAASPAVVAPVPVVSTVPAPVAEPVQQVPAATTATPQPAASTSRAASLRAKFAPKA